MSSEEFLKEKSPNDNYGIRAKLNSLKITKHVLEIMRRFAQMHVAEELRQASEKSQADMNFNFTGNVSYVIKDSILNSYSLDNVE
jgi:hypothetical protein